MNKLLLVPYNNAMRTGHGYNSFLQTPCVRQVVHAAPSGHPSPASTPEPSMPQFVSYNSRQVKHLSDLVQSMNISPASVIQLGSLKPLGHFTPVDETLFRDSDLNVVVSVLVMNQNNKSEESITFSPPADGLLPITGAGSLKFLELYGDSYISGFIEGGEFLGIVSVKVIDETKRESILKVLKGKITIASSDSSPNGRPVDFDSILEHTETTITVNWSGGGQIKPPNEQWSLNNLFQVAAGFPAKVAECPTNTWAILTRYDKNKSFVEWAYKSGVELPLFDNLHRITLDLLQQYMDYKSHIALLRDVISSPRDYVQCTSSKPVGIKAEDLLEAKTQIKAEMEKIVNVVNLLGRNQKCDRTDITPPELWGARLPVLKHPAFPKQITTLTDVIRPGGPIVPRGAPRTGTFEVGGDTCPTVNCGPGFEAKPGDLLVGMTYLEYPAGIKSLEVKIICSVENSQYQFRLEDYGKATCTFLNPARCGHGFQWGSIKPHTRTTINNIRFEHRFTNQPHVVAWISGLDLGSISESTVKVCASRVTASGFTLEAEGWTVRHRSAEEQVTWVAIPQSSSIKSGTILFGKGHPQNSEIAFSNDSEVFMAVNMFQAGGSNPCFSVMPRCRGDDEWCITSTAGVSDEDVVGVSYIAFSALDG